DEARQEPLGGLAGPRCRDEQRRLAPLARGEHIGLVSPEPPPARGEPVGEGGGERHREDVARRGTGDKSLGNSVQGMSTSGRKRTERGTSAPHPKSGRDKHPSFKKSRRRSLPRAR